MAAKTLSVTPSAPLSLVAQIMALKPVNGLCPVIAFHDFQTGGGLDYLADSVGREQRSVMVRWKKRTYSLGFSRRAPSRMIRGELNLLPDVLSELDKAQPGDYIALKMREGHFVRLSRVSAEWDKKPVTHLSDLPGILAAQPLRRAMTVLEAYFRKGQLRSMPFVKFWINTRLDALKKAQVLPLLLRRRGKVQLLTYLLVPMHLWQGEWPQRTLPWSQLGNFDLWPNYFGVEDHASGLLAVVVRDTDEATKSLSARSVKSPSSQSTKPEAHNATAGQAKKKADKKTASRKTASKANPKSDTGKSAQDTEGGDTPGIKQFWEMLLKIARQAVQSPEVSKSKVATVKKSRK